VFDKRYDTIRYNTIGRYNKRRDEIARIRERNWERKGKDSKRQETEDKKKLGCKQ